MSQIWTRLYDATLRLSAHRRAPAWLGGMAVAESSFFPIPVDVMLAPMVLARPERAWRFALIATLGSVAGGVIGFFIGAWLLAAITPLLQQWGYWEAFTTAQDWFARWGFWAVFVAGFTPIPYKVFTIAAGAAGMLLPLFVAASLIGRGARFYLVALLVRWGGPKVEPHLRRYMDQIAWTCLALLAVGLLAYRYW